MTNVELMNYWIESSDDDYRAMKNLYSSKDYSWCLFVGHLAIEKLIKGIYAKNNPDSPYAKKTHDLLILADKCALELDEDKQDKLDLFTTFNLNARYEDYKRDFYNKCTAEYTKEQVKNIDLCNWFRNECYAIKGIRMRNPPSLRDTPFTPLSRLKRVLDATYPKPSLAAFVLEH